MPIFQRSAPELAGAIVASVLLVTTLLLAASLSPAAPPAYRTPRPSGEQRAVSHRMVETLTGHRWQREPARTQKPGLTPEVTTWEFYAGGTFRWRFTSDYTESAVGAWALTAASANSGVLFLARDVHEGRRPERFHVLSVAFDNGGLRLGEAAYQGIPFTAHNLPPRIRPEVHEAVTAGQRHHFFSLWAIMTGTAWRSTVDPAPGDPTTYAFRQDGSYTAHFAATQCQYAGTWSLFGIEVNRGTIRCSVPANWCDPRGPRDAFVRDMPLTLTDTTLSLYQTVYVPVSQKGLK